MNPVMVRKIKRMIRNIPDFPKRGILFRDITPLLKHPLLFHQAVDALSLELKDSNVDCIVGIESRGFIFSPILAYKLRRGFVPVRKKGKLPYRTEQVAYDLEYAQAVLEIHQDALPTGSRVALVDDLLATGGTALAAAHLVEKLGGRVEKIVFLVELTSLGGRDKLGRYDVFSLIQY